MMRCVCVCVFSSPPPLFTFLVFLSLWGVAPYDLPNLGQTRLVLQNGEKMQIIRGNVVDHKGPFADHKRKVTDHKGQPSKTRLVL